MKTKSVAPKNKMNKIRNSMYMFCTNLTCISVSSTTTRNAIENIAIMKQIINRISKNFVSISYCDGMLLLRLFQI